MSLIRTTAAALIVCLAAASADAALVYGTGATTGALGANTTQSGPDTRMNGAPDGAFTRYSLGANTTEDFVVTWSFATAPSTIGWTLYQFGSVVRASVVGITLTDGALSVGSVNSQALPNTASGSGTTPTLLTNFDAQADYTTGSIGTFNWANIQSIAVTFRLTNNNARVAIDAIANPEPGTWALFGLGLIGLTGLVRRRRGAARTEASA